MQLEHDQGIRSTKLQTNSNERILEESNVYEESNQSENEINLVTTTHFDMTLKCMYCKKEFVNLNSLDRHELKHTSCRPYKCAKCANRFKRLEHLKKHMISFHPESTKKVQKMIRTARVKPFACDLCDKSFTKLWNLKLHKQSHTEANENKDCESSVVCYESDWDFDCEVSNSPDKESSEKHQLGVDSAVANSDKGLQKCMYCDKMFGNPYVLSRHEFQHTGIKPFKCDECDKRFKQAQHLKRHIINVHNKAEKVHDNGPEFFPQTTETSGVKPFLCDWCGKRFAQPWSLTLHMKSHSNCGTDIEPDLLDNPDVYQDASQKCEPYVQTGGSDNQQLVKLESVQSHSHDTLPRSISDNQHFDKNSSISLNNDHNVSQDCGTMEVCSTAVGESTKPEKHLECIYCHKSFNNRYVLSRHEFSHTGSKPFRCDICNKCFKQPQHLKRHRINLHKSKKPKESKTKTFFSQETTQYKGVKPFECQKCGKTFAQPWSLTMHMKNHIEAEENNCQDLLELSYDENNGLASTTTNFSPENAPPCKPDSTNDNSLLPDVIEPSNFTCKYCGKGFRNRYILGRHESTHTGKRPHKCDKCGLGFNQRHHLKRHQINIHAMKIRSLRKSRRKTTEEKVTDTNLTDAEDTLSPSMKMTINADTRSKVSRGQVIKNKDDTYVENVHFRRLRSRKSLEGVSEDNIYKCKHCQKGFLNLQVLRRHEFAHSGKRPYKCDICGKGFNQPHHLKRHRINIHQVHETSSSDHQISADNIERKPFVCDVCGKKFAQPWNLAAHTKSHWERTSNVGDSDQDDNFDSSVEAASMLEVIIGETEAMTTESDLSENLKSSESDEKCFARSGFDDIHSELQTDQVETIIPDRNPPLKSEDNTVTKNLETCSRDDQSEVKNSTSNSSAGNILKCKQCEKQFTNPYVLRRHEFTHTGAKPFKCGQCGKGFTLSHHVARHINNVHSSKKSFQCSICGLKYSHAGKIDKHMLTHDSDKYKIFICQICGKKFDQASKLSIHKEAEHQLDSSIIYASAAPSEVIPAAQLTNSPYNSGAKKCTQDSQSSIHKRTQHSDGHLTSASPIYKPTTFFPVSESLASCIYTSNSNTLVDSRNAMVNNQVFNQSDIIHPNEATVSSFQHPVYDNMQARMLFYGFPSSNEKHDLNKVEVNSQNTNVSCYSAARFLEARDSNYQNMNVVNYSAPPGLQLTPYNCRNGKTFSNVSTIQESDKFNSDYKNNLNYSTPVEAEEAYSQQASTKIQESRDTYSQQQVLNYSASSLQGNQTIDYNHTKTSYPYQDKQIICSPHTNVLSYQATSMSPSSLINTKPDISLSPAESNINNTNPKPLDSTKGYNKCTSPDKDILTLSGEKMNKTDEDSKPNREHSEEDVKPYKCVTCTKNFLTPVTLKAHMLLHEPRSKSFLCDVCGKGFYSALNLDTHYRIHSGEKPYKCPFCERRFPQSSGLEYHIRTHTGEKPFTCDVCEKSFACQHTLKTHYFTHTGEKPYPCEFCGKRFAQRSILWRHKKSHVKDGQAPILI